MFFDSTDDFTKFVRDPSYGLDLLPTVCFGVSVEESSSASYNYSLWFNITMHGPRTDQGVTTPSAFSKANF